jgi:hypothetical protein
LKLNTKISIQKRKAITINEEPIRCRVEIDGKMVGQVTEYNYLDVNIKSSGNLVKEIKTQAQIAAIVAGCFDDLVWTNKYMKKETKSKIYKATVHPIMRHMH